MISAKLQLLKETFESKFDIDKFKRFTREFFNEPEMLSAKRHIGIWKEYENNILSYSDIAKFNDADENTIIVLAVELKSEKGVERARSLQRNFISKILDDNNCEAAIVAFYSEQDSNWRLSFVRLDYTFKDKGLEIDLTPAKRYSYLVGENETSHTAQKQLYPIFEDDKHNPTLDEIEKAFSVEKVTKDFFEQYKNKYYDLKEYLEKDEAFINETKKLEFEVNKFSEQFSKKLMGQLAFLYFLQKKGWLGVRIMPEDHTIGKSKFMELYSIQDNYHKEILKKFFSQNKEGDFKLSIKLFHTITDYEADLLSDCFVDTELNMPWGSGDKRFIRGIFDFCVNNTNKNFFDDYLEPFFYEGLNKRRENQFYKLFNCKIPFLNGGLFEPLEGYHWKEVNFEIPNRIFSNIKEKGKEADGILDIFDRYNFTINEDEPLEKEVAVDPEMLGKIFENLLDGKDRKAKGAFYTPREIVHYMCQESIINYLVNKTNVSYEDMKEFILYGEIIRDADNRKNVGYGKEFTIKQSIFNKIVQIDQALENIKVADPAVGSGAFPLGMLNEIVRARNNITEYIIRLDKEGKLDRRYGEKVIRKRRSSYRMKWETIRNSIFAVDIEPSAVDIAKLRLWLSVVVEQEIDEGNKEPHTLPNLDCNIMVGNSLIDEYEGIKLFDETLLYKYRDKSKEELETHDQIASTMQLSMLIDYSDRWMKEMFELQNRLFDENDADKKKDIKERIDKIRDELIEYKLNRDGNKEGLKKYNEMKKLKMRPFFIWELEFAKVFKENAGFDVIIGNPPYVGESGNKDIFREIANTSFGKKYYMGKMDLFYFFFHKGINIGNENAEITFITTNYYPTAFGAKILRKDLKERTQIRKLINFNELKIFETALGQHNMITMLTKNHNKDIIAETCIYKNGGIADSSLINSIVQFKSKQLVHHKLNQESLYDGIENYIRLNGVNMGTIDSIDSVLEKMSKILVRLGNITEINQGVVTGCDFVSGRNINKLSKDIDIEKNDGIFVFDLKNPRDVYVIENFKDGKKLLRDFYKNSDISKYCCSTSPTKKILYYQDKLDENLYPDVKKHLIKFKSILEARLSTYNEKYHWTAIHRSRAEEIFTKPKIVVPYRAKTNTFAYNDVEWFCRSDVYVITSKNSKYDLKYLLALLNSKPYFVWLYYKGKRKGEILELFQVPLSEIPIIDLDEIRQKEYTSLVTQILEIAGEQNSTNYKKLNEDSKKIQEKIDKMVYLDLKLSEKEIDIIKRFCGRY